ncbi:TAXI family TRAP transporter solute-binding subunit [Pseudomonas guariconensis]|uniref:TAXI family TRAP transporter solute-binding subunit n=1 Tax=Pseudomonas guariconensis TaxID=1288410 RepID=UPI0018AC6284|nr:TAXI family TRAP transporter solute-binding subunit [Pseudomonas guariconensis]MBF8721777.1 hypothetical protein [Pseudomonas guariconensis]
MFTIPGIDHGPKLGRKVDLTFQGDWGQANFHRICSWLCQEVVDRCTQDSRISIVNGIGGADAALAIHEGKVDLAISTPVAFANMAVKGVGLFEGNAIPKLRALAALPQDDRMTFALDAKYGINTFEQLRASRQALRIGIGQRDGLNFIGYAGYELMAAHGITDEWMAERGGRFIERERPEQTIHDALQGAVDGVVQEAIMTPWWQDYAKSRKLSFISFEPEIISRFEKSHGWNGGTLKAGYFDGLDADVGVLDFSDFVLLVSEDMPDDLAYLLTWCLCETKGAIERQFQHLPQNRTPLSYPMDPVKMARTIIPLHPAAERCYRDLGHI